MNNLNGTQKNKENNVSIIYKDYEKGIKKLKKYHKTAGDNYVDFNVGFIPGLPGLPQSKISSLQERGWMVIEKKGFGVYLIKMNSKEQVEKAIEFTKNMNEKILNKIGFDGIYPSFIGSDKVRIEFEEINVDGKETDKMIFSNTGKIDKGEYEKKLPTRKITPYMRIQNFYTNKELLEENKEQLKQVDFFNNKANLFSFLQEKFPKVVPKRSTERCNSKKMKNFLEDMYMREDINYPIFVKSGIGASGSGLWKINNSDDFLVFLSGFDRETKDFEDTYTVFEENGELIKNLRYNFKDGEWENTRREDISFLIQENTILEFKDPKKVKEKSINFFIDDTGVYIVTECINNAKDGAYLGNVQTKLVEKERKKLLKIAKEIKKEGYRGPIGLDFFSDGKEIKIIESNPRNSGATNPQLLVYDINMELNNKLPDHIEESKRFHLKRASDEVKLEKDILEYKKLLFTPSKGYGIIPQISLDTNTHKQAIVMVFEKEEQYQEIIKELEDIKIKK